MPQNKLDLQPVKDQDLDLQPLDLQAVAARPRVTEPLSGSTARLRRETGAPEEPPPPTIGQQVRNKVRGMLPQSIPEAAAMLYPPLLGPMALRSLAKAHKQEFEQGDPLAAMVPVIGPQAAEFGREIGRGEYGSAGVSAAMLIPTAAGMRAPLRAGARAIKNTAGLVGDVAKAATSTLEAPRLVGSSVGSFGALEKELLLGYKPAEVLIAENINAPTNVGKMRQLRAIKDQVGGEIEAAVTNPTNSAHKIDVRGAIDQALGELASEVGPRGREAVMKLGDDWLPEVDSLTKGTGLMSPAETWNLGKIISAETKWLGLSEVEPIVNLGLQRMYGKIRSGLSTVVPEIGEPSARYGGLSSAGRWLSKAELQELSGRTGIKDASIRATKGRVASTLSGPKPSTPLAAEKTYLQRLMGARK